jgi:hypothetical protein
MSKAVQASTQWHIPQCYMRTIRGAHVQCMHMYVHVYTLYVHVDAMYIHVLTSFLNMVGRVPLIPLFLAGNSTPTIPHQHSQHKRSGFLLGSSAAAVTLQELMAGVALWQQCV